MGDALLQYSERYTVAEWETWNDPWELIHGFPYCMSPAPTYRHQKINTQILVQLETQLRVCKKCEAIMPIDWQIDEETVVQPDILVLCKPVTGKRLFDVPVALFEILSPSTKRKDKTVKFELYQNQGVKYFVLVDPESETIEAYMLDSNKKYKAIPSGETLNFDFEGCPVSLDMSLVWA